MHLRSSFASLLIFTLSSTTLAQNLLTPELDASIEGTLKGWGGYSGAGVAVVRRDKDGAWQVETKGYGSRGDGGKVDADTLFAIGSNTKLFNTITTGLLIMDENVTPRITFNTKVADVIPGFALRDPTASKEATIQDLASHRTGLPTHDYMYTKEDNIASIVSRLKDLKTAAGFREVFQYSNICYGVLSYLPEVLSTKMTFARYVKQKIFDPLGMSHSTFSHDVALKSGNVASGVARDNLTSDLSGAIPRAMTFWANDTEDGSYLSGAGGIISNAKDMAIWLQALMGDGKNPSNGQEVIPPKVLEDVATPYSIVNEFSFGAQFPAGSAEKGMFSPVAYGAGEFTNSYRGHEIIEHGGDVPGFHSQIARLPYDNLGIAVLTNDHEFGIQIRDIIKFQILDVLLGLPPADFNTAVQKALQAGFSKPTTPRPSGASEPTLGSVASLAGEYAAPGYGSPLRLCAFVPGQQPTEACQKMIAGKEIFNPKVPTLIAETNAILATHIALTHFNGNIFNVTTVNVLPTGDSEKPYFPARTTGGAVIAEFSKDESGAVGFGVVGGFWGRGPREPSGQTVEARSEVYWSKRSESESAGADSKSSNSGTVRLAHIKGAFALLPLAARYLL